MTVARRKNRSRQLTRIVGSGIDELTFYTLSTMRSWQHRQHLLSDEAEMQFLREIAKSEQAPFFKQLPTPALPDVAIQNQKMPLLLRFSASDYRYTRLTFPSAIKTGNAANDTVHAHHLYRPDHKNGPTLLFLHGWNNFDAALSLTIPLRLAAPLGFNVVLMELPHHIHRTAPGNYSGELSLTGNLPAMITTMQQAVSDTQALAGWLRARGIDRLALMGQSLGGVVAAMTLTLENNFDCAVLLVPAVEPSVSLWHSTYTRTLRTELSSQGIDEEATRLLLEVLRPARYQPALASQRILVIAAAGDRVAFSRDVQQFAAAWQTEFVSVEWGHLTSHLNRKASRLARFFLACWLTPVKA